MYRIFDDPTIWQSFILEGSYNPDCIHDREKFGVLLKEKLSDPNVHQRADFINILYTSVASGRFFGLDGDSIAKTAGKAKHPDDPYPDLAIEAGTVILFRQFVLYTTHYK